MGGESTGVKLPKVIASYHVGYICHPVFIDVDIQSDDYIFFSSSQFM